MEFESPLMMESDELTSDIDNLCEVPVLETRVCGSKRTVLFVKQPSRMVFHALGFLRAMGEEEC